MALVPLVSESDATDPDVKRVYDEIRVELGFGMVPNLFMSMATRPRFLEANWNHFRSTVLDGALPRTLKEMVGILISQHNASEYALRVHLHGLSALGISEEVLRLLVEDVDRCPLPEPERLALRFGLKAGTDPKGLGKSDLAALEHAGLGGDEIMELIATAHLFNAVNQYTDAIDLEIDAL